VLAWIGDENHPMRPVVEALSWVAGIGGFVVAVIALAVAQRPSRKSADVDGVDDQNPAGARFSHRVNVRDSRGVQIGDHNTQTNDFRGDTRA
jgi:hypothetical protein